MAQIVDRRVGALGATTLVLLAGVLLCAPSQVQAQPQSLYELVSTNADLLLLKEALDVAGLNGTLQDPALTYTVFAPTNNAFFSILAEMQTTPEALLTLGPDAAPFLLYHVLPTPLNSTDIPEGVTSVPTLVPGANVTVVRQGDSIVVNGIGSSANVTAADNYANGSVAHIVDNVLLPFFLSITSAAERTPVLSTLATALATAGLADTFRNPNITFTVFAPTNEAFTRTLAYLGINDINLLLADTDALTKVLQYHVLPIPVASAAITENATTVTTLGGAPVTVLKENGAVVVQTVGGVTANVLAADVPVGLGPRSLVHLVDAALVPWYPTVAAAVANNTNLSNFVAAVNAEGSYVSVIDGSTPFIGTIFAPTNAAFDVALAGLGLTLDQLVANQTLLKAVLDTHIIADQYIAFSDLTDGRTLTTLNNETLTVASNPGGAVVSSAGSAASVDRPELNINNGRVAVYVVETVLVPSTLVGGGSSPTPAPEPAPTPAGGAASIYDVVSSNANLTTLKAAIDAAGLNGTLSNTSLAWTVFAPTNDAFAAALAAVQMSAADLLALPQASLQGLLLYHVLPGAYNAASIPEAATALTTLAGSAPGDLTVRRTGSAVTVTSVGATANVITADVAASAGYAHVVDAVLLPVHTTLAQAVTSRTDLSILVAALNAANLTSVFSNPNLTYTVFAPTNAGFNRTLEALNMTAAQLLADVPTLTRVLQYHVLPTRVLSPNITDTPARVDTLSGDRVTVVRQNGGVVIQAPNVNASVTTADIPVGVGIKSVVHVVDAAMVPWYPSIAAAVAANPLFASLAAAIATEGTLSNVVSGAVPFSGTILAPNNNAFAALLLSLGITSGLPTPAVLRPILLTHVVNGTVLSTATAANGTVTTLGGQTLTVTRTASGEVRIRGPGNSGNGALVVGRETRIGNVASILELDAVLLPAAPAPAPPSPAPPSPGAASSALPSLGLLATSALAALALGLFGRLQ